MTDPCRHAYGTIRGVVEHLDKSAFSDADLDKFASDVRALCVIHKVRIVGSLTADEKSSFYYQPLHEGVDNG